MPAPVLKERLLAVVCSFGNKAPHFARRQSRKEYALSTSIINATHKIDQLRGSLFQTAKELAHRADGNSGIVQMSYSLLAAKIHQSRRTAIRHINRLVSMGIIKCQRFWQPGNKWGINRYQFIISWPKPAQTSRNTAQTSTGDSLAPTLPKQRNTREEREKFGSLKQEQKGREMVKEWLTKGSFLWKLAQEF
jgi:hypothetical protein